MTVVGKIESGTLLRSIYGRFRRIDTNFGHLGVQGRGEALNYIER